MKLPQLSLRELFWITLVVALSLGWWLDRSVLSARWEALLSSARGISTDNEAMRWAVAAAGYKFEPTGNTSLGIPSLRLVPLTKRVPQK